jgi:hypothetical protein
MPNEDSTAKRSSSLEELVASREARSFLKGKSSSEKNGGVYTREHADTSARLRASVFDEQRKDVTVKIPVSLVEALQRAMHERTLQHSQKKLRPGEPYTRQDIVTTAVEAWLRSNGYLS